MSKHNDYNNTTKQLVLGFLSDGNPHTLTEIREYLSTCNADFSHTKSTLNTLLFRLCQKNTDVKHVAKGTYQLISTTPTETKPTESLPPYVQRMHQIQRLCNQTLSECNRIHILDTLTYDEYQALQHFYRLNKQILELTKQGLDVYDSLHNSASHSIETSR